MKPLGLTEPELHQAIVDHILRLEQLARLIPSAYWSATTRERFDSVRSFVDRILSHLIDVDAHHSMAELRLVQHIRREIVDWEDASRFVHETAASYPDAPIIAPQFVASARLCDASGTRIGKAMFGEIESLLALVALTDRAVPETESTLIREILASIGGTGQHAGP